MRETITTPSNLQQRFDIALKDSGLFSSEVFDVVRELGSALCVPYPSAVLLEQATVTTNDPFIHNDPMSDFTMMPILYAVFDAGIPIIAREEPNKSGYLRQIPPIGKHDLGKIARLIIPEGASYLVTAAGELLERDDLNVVEHLLYGRPPEFLFALKPDQKCAILCAGAEWQADDAEKIAPFIKGKALRVDVPLMGATPLVLKKTYAKAGDRDVATLRRNSLRRKLVENQLEQNAKIAAQISNFFNIPITYPPRLPSALP